MWEVLEHRTVARKVAHLPREILERYEKWKDIVQVSGPAGLRVIKGFHDEALQGSRQGERSSRLGLHYRVIYRVEAKEVVVLVLDVTPHDYRRR